MSTRQDILTAQLRTALTKAERARAVAAHTATEPKTTAEVRHEAAFRSYLQTGVKPEERFAPQGVGSGSIGGFLAPPDFSYRVAQAMKEATRVLDDFQLAVTPNGRPMNWPVNSAVTNAATIQSENSQVQELDFAFSSIALPSAYMYGTGISLVSFQLMQDAFQQSINADDTVTPFALQPGNFNGQVSPAPFIDMPEQPSLSGWLAQRFGEIIGRGIAAHAIAGTGAGQPLGLIPFLNAAGAWSAGNSGGFIQLGAGTVAPSVTNATATELGSNALSIQTLAAMIAAVDNAYHPYCRWYLSPAQWANTLLLADSSKRPLLQPELGGSPNLMGWPVVLSNTIPALTASTTGGPVFGDLSHAMVHRVVAGTTVIRLNERYADFGQVGFEGAQRHDFRGLDARAAVTVKCAAT